MNRDLRRCFAALVVPVLFTGLVLCAGCGGSDGDGDDDPPPGNEVVWPLDTGNWWIYEYDTGQGRDQFTLQVTGTQDVNCTTVSKVEYVDYVVPGYYVLVRNATGGLYYYGDSIFGELTDPDLWCKHPCSVGDTWQTSGQGAIVNWEVIATSESVTVPAGTFNCMHVEGTPQGGGSTADHWYSVGTGWIKMTHGTITIELVDKDVS